MASDEHEVRFQASACRRISGAPANHNFSDENFSATNHF